MYIYIREKKKTCTKQPLSGVNVPMHGHISKPSCQLCENLFAQKLSYFTLTPMSDQDTVSPNNVKTI